MSTTHTPGPWMVLPSVENGQFCILTEHGNRVDIAVTYGFERQPREANARLISSAPELLEALKACLDKGSRWHPCDPVVIAARAAIAKAEGQQ